MVVMGSGNLGLNTARMAQDSGIQVAAVVDVSASVRGDETTAARLRDEGVPLYASHTVREATGTERRDRVRRAGRDRRP